MFVKKRFEFSFFYTLYCKNDEKGLKFYIEKMMKNIRHIDILG